MYLVDFHFSYLDELFAIKLNWDLKSSNIVLH